MKRRPYFLKNFPSLWICLLFALVFVLSYLWDRRMNSLGEPIEDSVFRVIRTFMLCGGAAAFALWRVVAFFPYPGGSYGKWLALTPWQYGRQLPKGSVQLNLTDLVVVGALCWLTRLEKELTPLVPLMIFLYAYIYTVIASTVPGITPLRYWGKRIIILIITPLAFYPEISLQNALICLAASYVLAYSHLRDVLKDYPWNTISWLIKQEEMLAFQSLKLPASGWPYCVLAPDRKNPFGVKNNTAALMTFSALLVWWLHACFSVFYSPGESSGIAIFIIIVCAALTAFSRLALLNGTAPPISFWGRILNGYFIIPKYDRIFIAPLIIIAIAVFSVKSLSIGKVEYVVELTDLSVFVILMTGMFCPPGIRQWFNTGAFRFIRNKMQEKQMKQIAEQKSGLNKPIKEVLLGK